MNQNIAIAREALRSPVIGQRRKYRLYREQILDKIRCLPEWIGFHRQVPYGKQADHRCLEGQMHIVGWDMRYIYVDRFTMVECIRCYMEEAFNYPFEVLMLPLFSIKSATHTREVHFKISWDKLWVDQEQQKLMVNVENILVREEVCTSSKAAY